MVLKFLIPHSSFHIKILVFRKSYFVDISSNEERCILEGKADFISSKVYFFVVGLNRYVFTSIKIRNQIFYTNTNNA